MTASHVLPTLLQRMRQRVLVPLALAWAASSTLVVAVSYASTAQAFDRALLDQAYSVAALLRSEDGRGVLSTQAIQFKAIRRPGLPRFAVYDGTVFIGGDDDLVPQLLTPHSSRGFESATVRMMPLRKLTFRDPALGDITVVVAQDLREREEWLKRLVSYSIVPQLLLLLVLGWWLGQVMAEQVAPLSRLQRELERRSTGDLSPLATQHPPAFEIAMLTQAVNALLQRIDRSVQAQREFAGNVAHELRTPLAGVRSVAEHALSSSEIDFLREQLRRVVKGCDRAARTVEQLLNLALAAEARETLRLEAVALDKLVRAVVLHMLPRADAAGVDLGAEGLDTSVSVVGHSHLLERVLQNLIDNALRYGRPLAVEVRPMVTVSIRRDVQGVWLSVLDNGPGIHPEDWERLRMRWKRGDRGIPDAQRRGGLEEGCGLGLSIVESHCALMHADLGMERLADGGFAVRLLLRSKAPDAAADGPPGT